MRFTLHSSDILDGQRLPLAQLFDGWGHAGENVSPQLAWDGPPEDTQSFVVTMFDPDAPTGSGWWHWVVVDIPASSSELARGSGSGKAELPTGALQARTDFGAAGYGGAAPPPGAPHRYVLRVLALSVPSLGVDTGASGAMVTALASGHKLAEATLTATYPQVSRRLPPASATRPRQSA